MIILSLGVLLAFGAFALIVPAGWVGIGDEEGEVAGWKGRETPKNARDSIGVNE